MRHLAATFGGALIAGWAICACAQQPAPIRILAIPPETRDLGFTRAEKPFTVEYQGKIAPHEHIFVRVFRGSPADLKGKYAQALRVGKCVLFTSSARYEAYSDGDGVLRISDVVDFFRNNTGQETQELTLVFEEGGIGAPPDQLKLSLDGLSTYFENAVTMKMRFTDPIKGYWQALADQKQAQQRAQSTQTAHSSGGLFSWFSTSAAAKENPPTPPPAIVNPAPAVVDGAVVKGPCQKVTAVPAALGKTGPDDGASADPVPLRAFAELTPAACGL